MHENAYQRQKNINNWFVLVLLLWCPFRSLTYFQFTRALPSHSDLSLLIQKDKP